MLMHCVSAVCVLGVVIVGLLVMVRIVTLEQLGNGIWRGFLFIVIALVTLCFLKGLLLPILTLALVTLKHMIWWVLMAGLVIIVAMILLRILVSQFTKWLRRRGNHNRGDL
jgi:uncharacterized membrane protein YkgB